MAGTTSAAGTSGAAGAGGSLATAYVVADADGVTARAEMTAVAYRYPGLPAGDVRAEGSATEWQWALEFGNAVGPDTTCTILLAKRSGGFQVFTSRTPGGSCSIAVTRAAPNVGDETEGTFSGVVLWVLGGTSTTQPITVTNGRFRVPRIADQNVTPGG